jgi:hypothetical protein
MNQYRPLAWMLCVFLGACASQPKEPPRIMMQGFSIAAPKEKEPTWIVAKQGSDLTVIGKPGRYSGETFTMQATVTKLPAFASADELLRYVESAQRKELDTKRYRLFKFEVKPQKIHEQTCALSRVEVAERTTADGAGSPVNVMMESLTLVCPHPKEPTRGFNMVYSHRHFPEDVDPQFVDDAALLMGTLAFEPL